jgi:hypothetical protein
MARAAKRSRRLWDTYLFSGFRPEQTVRGIFGDPEARVKALKRRSKKRLVDVAVAFRWGGTIASPLCTRSFVRRHTDISGIGGAADGVPPLWQGEAGTARLFGEDRSEESMSRFY